VKLLYGAYLTLSSSLFISLFPAFWAYTRITGKYRGHLKERLGVFPSEAVQGLKGRPRIWMHTASLGEVKVAASIVKALRGMTPSCKIIVSTVTEHGRKLARETFGEDIPVVYAPVDFVASVRKALFSARPDVMVFVETEIWPAWLFETHRMGIKTALINGRISVRSIGRYLKLRPFFRDVLRNVDGFSMIRAGDAERIQAMGADPRKIEINGNAKYDLLGATVDPDIESEMREVLNLEDSDKVFIAGSTRNGEEALLLDAYETILKEFPDTILIIAPRHIERIHGIEALVEKRGLRHQLWTDIGKDNAKRTEQVLIINAFGELFKIYSVGTLVFCGGSLVPLGGQNPLEPAAWGKAVFYGPSMENFMDAKWVLETNRAGIPVSSPEMLAEKAVWFLRHPEELKAYGERGRTAVLKNKGAGKKHARVIMRLWAEVNIKAENKKKVARVN
jgi:3-deoxy-D-manno-octulosonic-acid transferase